MLFSIIVPAYNAEKTLPALLDSLAGQSCTCFELIVVDDCSTDGTAAITHPTLSFQLLRQAVNRGPAHCRNVGAARAIGKILVFTDSDCRVDKNWLAVIRQAFAGNQTEAVMGKLVLDKSTYLGDSISALGFPAGGSLGFEKVWPVDGHGYTRSLSTCNCAVDRQVFEELGGFDESFPYAGGEDSFFACQLIDHGFRIQYNPRMIVHHEARDDFRGFLRWQLKRGESSYIFARKVTGRGGFVAQRLRSIINVLRGNLFDSKLPMVVLLLVVSYVFQIAGYGKARLRHKR